MLPFDYGDLGQIEAEIGAGQKQGGTRLSPPNLKSPGKLHAAIGLSWIGYLPVAASSSKPQNLDLDKYVKIGEEHTRTLEMKPGYLYVKDTVRPTYAIKDETEAIENGKRMVSHRSIAVDAYI